MSADQTTFGAIVAGIVAIAAPIGAKLAGYDITFKKKRDEAAGRPEKTNSDDDDFHAAEKLIERFDQFQKDLDKLRREADGLRQELVFSREALRIEQNARAEERVESQEEIRSLRQEISELRVRLENELRRQIPKDG